MHEFASPTHDRREFEEDSFSHTLLVVLPGAFVCEFLL
jgi:hypothetical protein